MRIETSSIETGSSAMIASGAGERLGEPDTLALAAAQLVRVLPAHRAGRDEADLAEHPLHLAA